MTDSPSPIRTRLNEAMKEAMRAKDSFRLGVIRMMLAGIKQRDIDSRTEDSRAGISDTEIFSILQRMIKQRQEGAVAFEAGGRGDLAAIERAEIPVIEEFLPAQLDDAGIAAAVEAAIAETHATSVKDMGAVMATLRARHVGLMDMVKAAAAVKARLKA